MNTEAKENRVLQYLEGDLSPEQERTLLADAAGDPELAAILADYRRQETLLHGFHHAQAAAADRVRRPDLSSLPAALAAPRRTVSPALRWMAAAAAVAVMAAATAVLVRPTAHGPLGTVAHATGSPRAFDGDRTVALAADVPLDAGFDRIKVPAGGSLEIALAGGGIVEVNEYSTVRLAGSGDAPRLELDRGEVLVQDAALSVLTPWFEATSSDATFAVARGLRGAEVAVARGTVDVRRDGTLRRVAAGEAWSSTGVRAIPVPQRVAWSRRAGEIAPADAPASVNDAPLAAPSVPVEVAAASPASSQTPAVVLRSAAPSNPTAPTTRYLPEGTLAFVDVPDVRALLGGADLSDALLGGRLRSIVLDGIDRVRVDETARERMRAEANAFFDNADLELLLSSLGGGASVGFTSEGPIVVAQVTDNADRVAVLVNETLPARMAGDELKLRVVANTFVAGFDPREFQAVVDAVRTATPSGFASSAFFGEVREAVGRGSGFVAASDVQAILRSAGDDVHASRAFRRLGFDNLRSIVASPSFADDADNRALQVRFDGPRRGVMAWLDEPGPMSGFEFFSPDAHVLAAARVKSPIDMLREVVAWEFEDGGLDLEALETDEGYLMLNSFASSLGGEVVVGLDNPVLPVPNVKIAVELTDPVAFHDGMLEFVDRLSAAEPDLGRVAVDSTTYRNHLIVDVRVPGKVVGLSYAVVDDYAVFGPGRPFLQAAIDTFVDGRSIDREPAFVEALPAKSGSNVSLLVYAARNESLDGATPLLAQALADRGVPIDLDAVAATVPGRSVVLYAIAQDDRVDYYVEGIKGDFQMTGMLPAVTQWLVDNGG